MTSYALYDLAEAAGVTPRTVRFYIQQGLLPSAGVGPRTRYGEGHLARLQLIRELQRQHLPLAEIRVRLAPLRDEEVREVLEAARPRPSDSALDYVRSVLAGSRLPAPSARFGPARGSRAADVSGGESAPAEHEPFHAAGLTPAIAPATPKWQTRRRDPGSPPGEADTAARAARRVEPDATTGATARGEDQASAAAPAAMAASRSSPTGMEAASSAEDRLPPRKPDRSQWERLVLHPDIELHVRRPLSRHLNRQVDRLVGLARQLLEEDQP
ncbi:MAG: MerR family transcriptional regulator [Chloroflexota bacterium]|nr:MerR family transcriptional regulator [Chloroflexota bacterium]